MGKGSSERSLEYAALEKLLWEMRSEGNSRRNEEIERDGDSQAAMNTMKVRTARIAVWFAIGFWRQHKKGG